MAALAVPALEVLADAALVALRAIGVIGGTAVVGEAVKKKVEEAENAKASPIAKTDAGTKKPCQKCPPDAGNQVVIRYSMSENSREYQARITGFAPGTEWRFEGRDFDGFKSPACLLQEAKADYDQFFDDEGDFRYKFQPLIFRKMTKQATAQAFLVHANPPTSLTYYFQTPRAYEYMKATLTRLGIAVVYMP